MWAASVFAALAALVLTRKKLILVLRAKCFEFEISIDARRLFGRVGLPLRYGAAFDLKNGLRTGVNGRYVKRPRRPRRKKRIRVFLRALLRSLSFGLFTAGGRVGLKDSPDKSVVFAGCMESLLLNAYALSNRRGSVNVTPCFSETCFDLNLEWIIYLSPLKLLKEAIIRKKR